MSLNGNSGYTIKDLKDWADNGQPTADYLRSQIDNIVGQDPDQAGKMIHDTMEYSASLLSETKGGAIIGEIVSKVLWVVEFSEPSFPTEDAVKAQNSALRWLIDLSNTMNDMMGIDKK